MKHLSLRFTLHRQCQDMFETYRRDGGIGQSALDNYQRTAEIQAKLRRTLRPVAGGSTSVSQTHGIDVTRLKTVARRMRTTVSPYPTPAALPELVCS